MQPASETSGWRLDRGCYNRPRCSSVNRSLMLDAVCARDGIKKPREQLKRHLAGQRDEIIAPVNVRFN